MQVHQIAPSGYPDEAQSKDLSRLQENLGLFDHSVKDIIKSVRESTSLMLIEKLQAQGKLNLDHLLEMSNQGIKVEKWVTNEVRMQMIRTFVEKNMKDGNGALDIHRFLVTSAEALHLDTNIVRKMLEETAHAMMKPTLVQAVSLFRQRKIDDMVKCIQNLVSQHRFCSHSVAWVCENEIKAMLKLYMNHSKSEALTLEAAKALGYPRLCLKELTELTEPELVREDNKNNTLEELSYFMPQ